MENEWKIIGREGFLFLGKMNASISHEIKNVLAVINENAGLLEDMVLMADEDRPVSPDKLKDLAGRMIQQVRRADRIVKNMNTLAHSVDEPEKTIDISATLSFMAAVCKRLASMKRVEIVMDEANAPCHLTTNSFLFENIVWKILEFSMNHPGEEKRIRIFPESSEKGITVRFSGLADLSPEVSENFPGDADRLLAASIGATVSLISPKEILLSLPSETD